MLPAAFALLAVATLGAQDDAPVVFRSDVSLVRVDVQVLDRSNRAVTGLRKEDFILREGGREREIRNFANEEMAVDVLFLVDVSGSMRPHVERLAAASESAMRVLGSDDRVAIMVFDRATRVRTGFTPQRELRRHMEMLLDQEHFNGGTDITRAMLDAAQYVDRHARRDARHAIVILTDDRTEFDRADARVLRALSKADTVMMALLAPDMMGMGGQRRQRFPQGGGGGGWPNGGGGLGGPLGGIILGRGGRYPGGGGGYPTGGRIPSGGGGPGWTDNQSAGTAEIARESGGDSMSIEDGSAVETTLSRIRQRYALYFLVPDNARAGEQRQIEVTLASRRYADAELRYRRDYYAPAGAGSSTTVSSTEPAAPAEPVLASTNPETQQEPPPRLKRRPTSDGSGTGPRGPNPELRNDGSEPSASGRAEAPAGEPAPKTGGWRRLKPGEKP